MNRSFMLTAIATATMSMAGSSICMAADTTFTYAELKEYEFEFCSGVGAWGTYLTVNEDGSFEGAFHDSNMGEDGVGYPNGTVYICSFSGKFAEPEYVNEFTYVTKIEEMTYDETPDKEEIIDGVRYVYSEPYGLSGAQDIYFYMPGTPLKNLPEGYLDWVRYMTLEEDAEILPYYGIYNEAEEEGFYSWIPEDTDWDSFDWDSVEGYDSQAGWDWDDLGDLDDLSEIGLELRDLENKADEIAQRINSGNASQTELNMAASDLYMLWDVEINDMWARLKNMLSKDEMDALTKEEIDWINYKEEEIKKAGLEVEGGSMQPMLENLTGAELTRVRVYELAEYFR